MCAKTGADVLFVEPRSKAADVGVTVSPIRIRSLEQFGDLAAVGDRLLAAERSKVGTQRGLCAESVTHKTVYAQRLLHARG